MKTVFLFVMLMSALLAQEFHFPKAHFIASGGVHDILTYKNKLYAATDASCVDIFDLKSQQKISSISLDKIVDFMGEPIDTTIFSVDVIQEKVMLLSEGLKGYSRVSIYENGKLSTLIKDANHLAITKAKFIDAHTLLLALLSDEIISYDIKKHRQNYRVDASASKFSDFVLSEDKSKLVLADESGDLQLLRTQDGKHLKSFTGKNLDDVFGVDFKKGIIATAGKDRRVVIYDTKHATVYYKKSSFFIYSVGLSPSGKRVAYSSDVHNNITLFNTQTKETIAEFSGNKSPLSKILFIDEDTFLVASAKNVINLYTIP